MRFIHTVIIATVAMVAIAAVFGDAVAAPPGRDNFRNSDRDGMVESFQRPPTPLEDDARLNDVHFVSGKLGWAVGDHGVIWHTRDGGKEWTLQTSGVRCALHSVCFLTNQVGWVAGGGTMPFTRLSYGVLLHTTDGGRTWKILKEPPSMKERPAGTRAADASNDNTAEASAQDSQPAVPRQSKSLPRLTRVKFFSLQEGFVVGQGTADEPSGVFFTGDGGNSWNSLPGEMSPGWLAADFLNPEVGVVAGGRGQYALIKGEQVAATGTGTLGPRGLRDVALVAPRSGWLVGDGGLVLRTDNAGLVWEAPLTPLPERIRDACDFHAVSCRGKKVWLAGQPGSVVWHSEDGGRSWLKQSTGQTVPINALHFANDAQGCAVGALGMILRTEDGGRTWEAARGGRRRAAFMLLSAGLTPLGLEPVVELSGESGYRSVVSVAASEALSPIVPGRTGFPDRLAEAVVLAGGSASEVNWQLPLDIPGLERDREKLIAEWNRRTEGRYGEILAGHLVRQLRTWRPSVLILEQPSEGDALTPLINDAALKAIDAAKDSTSFVEHQELAELEPWPVAKVFLHLPPGSTGNVHVDPHRYLPRLEKTSREAAAPAASLVVDDIARPATREAYRLLRTQWEIQKEPSVAPGFFAGLAIASGSDARRQLAPFDEDAMEARIRIANRQKVFAAHAEKALGDPRQAGQFIAQLPEISRGMTSSQAALQLADLAERYQDHGQWELAELVLAELVDKYPDEPASLRAMQQLVQCWASAEVTWRRLKKSASGQQKERSDPSGIAQTILQVEARLEKQAREEEKTLFDVDAPTGPVEPVRAPLARPVTAGYAVRRDFQQKVRVRQAQALRMARNLERRSPELAAAPEVQFPLAAVFRQLRKFARSDEIHRRFLEPGPGTAWYWSAEGELWVARPIAPPSGPAAACVRATQRPFLDGNLADECWQDADELLLAGERGEADRVERALAMLCYDDEYLYLAASLPRPTGTRLDGPAAERHYDDDLSDFDRVAFYLDTDRDRVTYYQFTIDQRGCTSESCWHDRSWNPRGCFVKVDADERHWRLEAAIPFDEIASQPPVRGDAWAVGVVRTTPAVGCQSWTQPAGEKPRPETFGLIRFE